MASRPFQFLEKKRSKIRKRAAKHFEGLAALSTHSAGQRAEVKAGCKPVHFSLDGCPLSRYFSGSVATTSGHFGAVDKRFTRGENHGKISAYGGGKMQLKFHMVTIEDLVPEGHFLRKETLQNQKESGQAL